MLLDGGLGDHIGSLVAVKYVLTQYPWITPLIWVPDYFVDYAKHLLPSKAKVYGFSDLRSGVYNPNYPTKTTKWDGSTSPMKIHLVDYGFLKLTDENPSLMHKNYLQIDPTKIDISHIILPKAYAVITTGFTAEVREFLPDQINAVANYLNSLEITPVYLGATITKTGTVHTIKGIFKNEIDFSKGINLVDKTNLLEAAAIMHNAKAVIGVDNGLLHIAGTTQTPIIGGFTTVTPNIRMPIRNGVLGDNYYPITPDPDLQCGFCQEKTNFLYGHDYRNCLFKGKNSEKTNLCTKQMTAIKFIKAFNEMLNKNA